MHGGQAPGTWVMGQMSMAGGSAVLPSALSASAAPVLARSARRRSAGSSCAFRLGRSPGLVSRHLHGLLSAFCFSSPGSKVVPGPVHDRAQRKSHGRK